MTACFWNQKGNQEPREGCKSNNIGSSRPDKLDLLWWTSSGVVGLGLNRGWIGLAVTLLCLFRTGWWDSCSCSHSRIHLVGVQGWASDLRLSIFQDSPVEHIVPLQACNVYEVRHQPHVSNREITSEAQGLNCSHILIPAALMAPGLPTGAEIKPTGHYYAQQLRGVDNLEMSDTTPDSRLASEDSQHTMLVTSNFKATSIQY